MDDKKDNDITYSRKGKQIKKVLAEYIGVDEEDIHDDDSLQEDLHMGASELSDFILHLAKNGIDVESIDLVNVETVEDLIEKASQDEF